MPTMYLLVGLPASGKSSWARGKLEHSKKTVRVNYDDIRSMLGKDSQESAVQNAALSLATAHLEKGYDVIVDNTNLSQSAQDRWSNIAREFKSKLEVVDFRRVSVSDCVQRDGLRQGDKRVSPPVIWNMALKAGLLTFSDRPKVIVDIDGTLACHDGVRSPYDESLVHLDTPYPVVLQWVKNLVQWNHYCIGCFHDLEDHSSSICVQLGCFCGGYSPAPDYEVIVVSGRSTECGLSTYNWLRAYNVPFTYLFMRNRGDKRPDTVVKQEFLTAMLNYFPKEKIVFVLDDRPCVVKEVWRKNGITVYPVRGECEDF
jgi:predicted kinase